MIVISDKLSLRYAIPSDAKQLFHYTGNLESSKYLASNTHLNPQQTQKMLTRLSTSVSFKLNAKAVWVIYLNEIEAPIGMLTLIKDAAEIEIHFGLIEKFTGRGFASQALSLAASHCCSSKIAKQVVSFTDKENVVAQAVLIKAGFKCTGSRENFYSRSQFPAEERDVFSYLYSAASNIQPKLLTP